MQLVTIGILARLLSPSDFGLLGMAGVVIGFVDLFKDLGTSAAVVQQKNPSEVFLSSIFWVNVFCGLLAMVALFAIAPLAADIYQEPRVEAILKVLSFVSLVSGLSIVQRAILERNLAFRELTKIEMFATVCGCLIAIFSALMKAGVWSLVYQSLATMILGTFLLWISASWKPKWVFRWIELKSVSGYSLNLTGFSIFNYFARNADYFLIGRYLGAQNLGYYTLAYRIMIFPLEAVSTVLGKVMFPVYAQLQDDDAKLRQAYLRVAGSIALVAFPMMFGLLATVRPFVLSVFGATWSPVILLLLILAPVGLVQSIATSVGAIYQAKGRTDWMFLWGLGSGTLVVIAFVVGLAWGIIGIALGYAIVTVFVLSYPNFAIPFKLIGLPVRDLVRTVWRPFTASFVMLIVMLSVRLSLPHDLAAKWTLAILVLVGCMAYAAASTLMNRTQFRETISLLTRWDKNKDFSDYSSIAQE